MSRTASTSHIPGRDGDEGACPPEERYPKLADLLGYLDSLAERADLDKLATLLSKLEVSRDDIQSCCRFSGEQYQRNIIKESPWYELVALCWKSGQRTAIHDHRGSSCAFKVIEGDCTEMRFEKTPSGLICATGSETVAPGSICASYDDDIHQVLNAQPPGEDLITLHIYSPPLKNYRKYTLDSPCPKEQVQDAAFHANVAD